MKISGIGCEYLEIDSQGCAAALLILFIGDTII